VNLLDLFLKGRTNVDRQAVEDTLPPVYRGRRGYTRMLDTVPLRISISGTRGKSSLTSSLERELRSRGYVTFAKQTGTDPVSISRGERHPVDRPARGGALFDENIWELKRFWGTGFDALILENQAISGYTMRVFNALFCKPHYLLITNIRRDHFEDLGSNMHLHPRAFGRSAGPGTTVISGEMDEERSYLLRREVESVGGHFLDAAPRRGGPHPPGYESVTITDALLRDATGTGLEQRELAAAREALDAKFGWEPSALPDVAWYHGGEINDVDSTRAIHRYLQHKQELPTTLVAYFRPDRRGRTDTFTAYLREELEEGTVERVILAGHGSRHVARRLRPWQEQVECVDDDLSGIPALVDDLAESCRGGAVMTVANAVPPFPRALAEALAAERGQPAA
jgi:hypothetical protein